MFKIVKYCTSCICSQTWKTAQESALTSVTSERDELAEEKTDLEGKLMVLQSQTHELQVRRCMVMDNNKSVVLFRPVAAPSNLQATNARGRMPSHIEHLM